MEDRAIGIFDSGIGGLTVLKELIKILPNENIIYYADAIHAPYGSKSKQVILNFSCQIIKFLIAQNVKLIIIACNTVSTNCFEELKKEFDIPIIEVLSSGVEAGIAATKNKIIGLIATELTIQSRAYEKCITMQDSSIKVISKACPLFVPLAEKGLAEDKISYRIAKIYLDEFTKTQIDTLILACTHYPLFISSIKKILPMVEIINPATRIAINTKKYLVQKKILRARNKPEVSFYTSGSRKKFHNQCEKILEINYPQTKFIQKILT